VSEQLSDLHRTDLERSGQVLVERLIASMSADNPQLPELLMAAALPRGFDKAVLAALTAKDPADAEFSSAFAGLIAFPFVYDRAAGMYSLHDSIRSVLLKQWRDRADFQEHLRRLLAYHNERYQQAQRTARALATVAETMRRINVSRWSAASERTEDLLIRRAIEALHVALMISPDEGWQRMIDTFIEFEGQSRFRLCGMLVSAFAEHTDDVPASSRAAHDGWAAYFAARLANDRQRWEEADNYLKQVQEPERIDLKLASWLYSEKARNLMAQYRFDEAIAMHDRDIALEEEHHIDPWNASIPWGDKAQVYRQLWDQAKEAEALREAVRLAAKAQNNYSLVIDQCLAVDALAAVGDFDSAIGSLLEALRITRQNRNLDVASAIRVAGATLSCLGPRSARLLDAIAAQFRQLAQPSWPVGRLELLMIQADALIAGGNIPAAIACFEQARELAVEYLPERVWEVDSRRASWAANLGEPAFGAEVNLELLRDPGHAADKWETGSLLHNAADAYAHMGKYREALTYLQKAREVWESIHHDRAVSLTWAIEANLLRRLGDLEGARLALAKTADVTARGYQSARIRYGARLALDSADYAEAASLAPQALVVHGRPARKDEVGDVLLAVEALCAAGDFREAAKISARTQDLLSKLEAFCAWKPTDDTHLADEHAARAVRIMLAGQGSDSARLQAAREHLELATGLDPTFGWFQVELAFVELGQGRQRQAIRRLTDAARLTDDEALSNGILKLRDGMEKPSSGHQ
jgi:tetratricopeptide (TPR) repeat protein